MSTKLALWVIVGRDGHENVWIADHAPSYEDVKCFLKELQERASELRDCLVRPGRKGVVKARRRLVRMDHKWPQNKNSYPTYTIHRARVDLPEFEPIRAEAKVRCVQI